MSADIPASCPRCGALVRQGSDWCTLCFADLRPVPPARLTAGVAGGPAGTAAAGLGTALGDLPAPGPVLAASGTGRDAALPCPTCGAPIRLEDGNCAACGTGLFDRLRDEPATLRLPVVGDLMAMSKGARTTVAIGVASLAVTVLIGLLYLLGAVV